MLGVWVQACEGAVLDGRRVRPNRRSRGATGARPGRGGGRPLPAAERAGECGRAHRPTDAVRPPHSGTTRKAAAALKLVRTAPGGEAPLLGPWRTSPSPTPGPLPPDGVHAGGGTGRSTPFPQLPAHGAPRRVCPTPRPPHHQPHNKPQHEPTTAHPDRTTPTPQPAYTEKLTGSAPLGKAQPCPPRHRSAFPGPADGIGAGNQALGQVNNLPQ